MVPTKIKENLDKLEARLKRGRPALNTPALEMQPVNVQDLPPSTTLDEDEDSVDSKRSKVTNDGDILRCGCKTGCPEKPGRGRGCACRRRNERCGDHCKCGETCSNHSS